MTGDENELEYSSGSSDSDREGVDEEEANTRPVPKQLITSKEKLQMQLKAWEKGKGGR